MNNQSIKVGPVERVELAEREVFVPKMRVATINDYLLCFYDGREIADYPTWVHGNIDMQLGLSCYVMHRNGKAVIFDTMLYKEHIFWIDDYLQSMGITVCTVINSHWDPDHIAGNFMYKNAEIISTNYTKHSIDIYAKALQSGEVWQLYGDPSFPGFVEVVSPNRTFEGKLTIFLDDLRIDLYEVFLHVLGSLVAYLPQDKILLAADACEDSVLFIPPGSEGFVPHQILTYHKLNELDIERIFPTHGRFEVINNGGYRKEFIDAMIDYKTRLISEMQDPDYLTSSLESCLAKWVENGTLTVHEPYRWLHQYNRQNILNFYKDKPKPTL
ncbi:MAG TPA: MBL fold metallo-hydrolase [Pseudomonas pachastrellae]|nr:MBL fold metallo-hydrolase [Halopseudomonas pachastrellae]